MAQSAGTYLEAGKYTTNHATVDIRRTDRENEAIREESLKCYINAKKIMRITNERDTNPSFDIVTYIMKLMMGLEERAEEARKDICYLLDHRPG